MEFFNNSNKDKHLYFDLKQGFVIEIYGIFNFIRNLVIVNFRDF
ncbi:hypothetical protein LEP1GSC045_2106 [Leptospira interrogans serovar Pomona str. Kennewicki LC82-25]|nr:hypothetical protein LEP1GSC045_2106 [Leptospira interrogans serovar Pomona str. Kennewicki LC82-25]EKN98180.1 hypothetical protein LEP1GSC014_1059 [Leptospira interrogans serovar Pomona str. Pomona]EMF31650.1 hypothetical protein LEP1GSC201_3939 [Leptospira interrogans serovar Pomona str. Fox 32256]EMI68111.1 hypothetical protein LEP1GSC200_4317 [Leptospira interrogans serovar Pomona str. CSL10083]EMJ58703.1 hypothetical protein LEP1GSC197_2345 [Leptospira interrogans serovar Pomona str. CS